MILSESTGDTFIMKQQRFFVGWLAFRHAVDVIYATIRSLNRWMNS